MRSLSLKTRITAGVSLVVVLSLFAAMYLMISYFDMQLRATIVRNQFLMTTTVANEIDSKLLMAHKQLILTAREVPLAALHDPRKAQQFLDTKTGLRSLFDNSIGLFTSAGIDVAESPYTEGRRGRDFSFRPYFKKTIETRKPVISDPYLSSHEHNHPAIIMTAPVFNSKGALVGCLIGGMDLMGDNILGDIAKIKIGNAGYISLTTSDRIMVMHPDRSRILKPIPVGNRLYDAAVDGYEGTDETVTTTGIAMLTSVKRMKVNGWILVASYPQSEAYAAVSEMKQYLLAASAVVVTLIFFMISFMIRRFMTPLAHFIRHVNDLPRKEGAAKLIHLDTDDEIGTLSRSFNTMVVELDHQQDVLRESESKFRGIAEKSVVGIYLIQDGLFRYVNPRMADIFGFTLEEMIGLIGPRDLMHPEDWPAAQEYIRERIEGEVSAVHYSFRGRTRKNEFRLIEVYGSATVYQGRPAIIGTLLDVTERKRAEEALRESEVRFRELADALPQTIFEIDVQGRFLYINRAAWDTLGYSPADLERGVNVMDVIAPQDRERVREDIRARMQGDQDEHHEYTALRKDGTTLPVVVHAGAILRNGKAEGMRGILIDISDRKRLEAEVLRSQKLESIGVMAGGIAHDFNNMLSVILGNLSLAKMELKTDDSLYQGIDEAEKASLNARNLTQQLLTFARGGRPVKKVIALEPLVRDAVGFARRGSNVKVEFYFADELRAIEADAGQLGQVFNNFFINASHAMPNGGMIVITAENHRVDMGSTVPVPAGDYVRVKIEDQGTGISPENLVKIFDPYFTTKQKGSGLGLAIAYSVVKHHNGHIDVVSTPGKGTTFLLYLPATEREVVSPVAAEAAIVIGKGRVLVMDDEELVRSVVTAMLTALGYEAVTSRDGNEAIRLYCEAKAERKAFDAVIMDLTIPGGMGGKDAIRELCALDPQVKAIVSSGYSDDPVMADFKSYGFSGVVKKPCQISELSDTLHRVIHGLVV